MRIRIIAPGKIKEKWLREAIADYSKRLRTYTALEIIELADAPDSLPLETGLKLEGERILREIKERDYCIALDLAGKELDSLDFASAMAQWFERGGSSLTFIIGGSNGLAPELLARADQTISLSRLTFTHMMARLFLLEQCYRAFRIQRNEPYHK